MSLKWEFSKLKDLITLKTGKLDSNQEEINGTYPFFTCAPNPSRINSFAFNQKAILLAGNNANGNFHINYYEGKFNAYQRTYVINVLDAEKLNLKYLFYSLKICLNDLKRMSQGTSTRFLTKNILNNFEIGVPPMEIQKKIVNILDNLSDKIKVNKKINSNLEEQILKIFNNWFVKFSSFDELEESKLGLIPKGWSVDYLGSGKSSSIIGSGIVDFGGYKVYIATADVDNSSIINNKTLITLKNKPSRANMQPIEKSIWFAKMIDSRKLIMVDDYCEDILNNYIFSTGFCGLKCSEEYFYYLWTFLLTNGFDTMKNNFCTGTTMQAVNNKDIKMINFVLPDLKTVDKFNIIAEPIFKKIYLNNLEIQKLTKLRDTLLPKLMSGEINVSKINCDLN